MLNGVCYMAGVKCGMVGPEGRVLNGGHCIAGVEWWVLNSRCQFIHNGC